MHQDAWNELESLPPELRADDGVLELRIQIYQALGKWESARVLAESLAKRSPENSYWWILVRQAKTGFSIDLKSNQHVK
jgi:uncharacterized protein HemY